MTDGPAEIHIDSEVWQAAAQRLSALAEDIAGVGSDLAADPISVRSFGLMNAWMAPPIAALASTAAEVVGESARLGAGVAIATGAAADDFAAAESRNVGDLQQLESTMDLPESRRYR